MRRGSALLAATVLLLGGCGDDDAATRHHDPVVFVHGYSGSAADWDVLRERLRDEGWPAEALPEPRTYSSSVSNVRVAEAVRDAVARVRAATGAAKVDVVTFSMGGVSSRYFLRFLGGAAVVDDWVSLGGPNHGTAWAGECTQTPCREMRPGGELLRRLNAGDETPGRVRYATWASPCDQIIRPPSSTFLRGARNTTTACLGHTALLGDPVVHAQVIDALR